MSELDEPILKRFWSKVNKFGGTQKHTPELGQCWTWLAGRHKKGYGVFYISTRRPIKSHRYSWIIHNGPIPENLWVLHKCDNPPCCNPDHLFLGTNTDNLLDASKKGRLKYKPTHAFKINPTLRARGEGTDSSKMTNEKVLEIRAGDTKNLSAIARKHGVSQPCISAIVKRKTWTHI